MYTQVYLWVKTGEKKQSAHPQFPRRSLNSETS